MRLLRIVSFLLCSSMYGSSFAGESHARCLAMYVTGQYGEALSACSVEFSSTADAQVAYYILGEMHEYGRGLPANLEQAMKYYELSAEAGYPPAMLRIANYYSDSESEKALNWYVKSGRANWTGSGYSLSRAGDMLVEAGCYAKAVGYYLASSALGYKHEVDISTIAGRPESSAKCDELIHESDNQ